MGHICHHFLADFTEQHVMNELVVRRRWSESSRATLTDAVRLWSSGWQGLSWLCVQAWHISVIHVHT